MCLHVLCVGVSGGTGVCTQVVVRVHLCVHWMWVYSVAWVSVWLAVFARLSVCLLTHIACVFLRDVGCGLRPSVLLWAVPGPGLWSLLAG